MRYSVTRFFAAACALIFLAFNVVQADDSNSFFKHFQRAKDLTAERLQSYLLANTSMTHWVIEYVSQLPSYIITSEGKQTLLEQLRPLVGDGRGETTTSRALPVIESSDLLSDFQIGQIIEVLPESQPNLNYRYYRGPIIEYRLSSESRIEWNIRNESIRYEVLWD